eukprot:UN00606
MVKKLLKHTSLNNQFFDIEAFYLKDGSIKLMEMNCRTFSNQLPSFARVYGPENCMITGAIDLLNRKKPAMNHQKLIDIHNPKPNGPT